MHVCIMTIIPGIVIYLVIAIDLVYLIISKDEPSILVIALSLISVD